MNIPDTKGMYQYFLVFQNQAHLLLSDLSGLQWKEWKPPSAIVWERCFLSHPNHEKGWRYTQCKLKHNFF